MQPSPPFISRTLSSSPTETLFPWNTDSPPLPPAPGNPHSTFKLWWRSVVEVHDLWRTVVSVNFTSQKQNHTVFVLFVCCCCSVAKLCPILCYPMDCSTPGFPVLCYLLEFAQTHVHWVGDTIQPPHTLLPHFFLPSIFPSFRVFSNESALCIR